MSRFRETSEITALNRVAGTGVARPAVGPAAPWRSSPRIARYRMTRRRFDPRVLVDLDRLGYRGAGRCLSDRPTRPTRTGSRRPATRGSSSAAGDAASRSRVRSTSAGSARGLTLRWAADRARSGLAYATSCSRPAATSCRAGRTRTAARGRSGSRIRPVVTTWPSIAVADQAVATSSVRVNRWTVDGRSVHHLLDPRTGEPADGGLVAVTVAGPTRPGPRSGPRSCSSAAATTIAAEARARGLAAWWVTDDGMLEMTPAARAMTIWVGARSDRRGLGEPASPSRARASSSAVGRHPLAGPGARDRERGRHDGAARGLGEVQPGRQPGRERAVERVAGPDRVDDLDPRRRGSRALAGPPRGARPVRPRLTRTRAASGLRTEQPLGPGRRAAVRARQGRQLALVRGQDVGEVEGRPRQARRRRRVEDGRRAGDPGEAQRLVRGAGPDLVPDEDDVVLRQARAA